MHFRFKFWNGLEFANHENISEALECNYYFCHPYSSWGERIE